MYSEVAWVLVSSGTQVQPQIILEPSTSFVLSKYMDIEKIKNSVHQIAYGHFKSTEPEISLN